MVASQMLAEIRADNLMTAVVVPMPAAVYLLGMKSATTVKKHLPIVKTCDGKHGVTYEAIKQHIAKNTTFPAGWVATSNACAVGASKLPAGNL